MTRLRCSSLDRAIACPGSVLDTTKQRISSDNEFAKQGKAGHNFMSTHLEGGEPDLRKAMEAHGLSSDDDKVYEELNYLCTYCVQTWDKLKHFFPAPKIETVTEFPLDASTTLAGTMDVASVASPDMQKDENVAAIVLDWKFGFIEYGYFNQIAGYAWGVWNALKKPQQTIVTVCVFPRHRFYRVHRFAWHELKQWEYDLVHNTLARPDVLIPSYRCATCDIAHACDARRQKVMQTMADLSGGGADLTVMCDKLANCDAQTKQDPEMGRTVLQMLHNIKVMEEATKRARGILKSTIERVGGIPVIDEAGNKLELDNTLVHRRKLNPAIAWPIICKYMTPASAVEAATFNINKLRKEVLAAHPKGHTYGAGVQYKTADDMMKELEDANGIILTEIKRMELKEQSNADTSDTSTDESGTDSGASDGDAASC